MMDSVDPPRIGDAFGETLARCWEAGAQRGAVPEIIERDDGFINANDAARYFAGPEQWSPLERWAVEQASGRVLDVGCGAGRHALALSAAGHEVVGLEPSPGVVAVARHRGVNAAEGSLLGIPSELGRFDTILLLGNNVGLLGSREDTSVALEALAQAARPDGRLLASGIDPHATNDPAHTAYHQRNRQLGRLPGHIRMRVRHRGIATEWFDYVFRSLDEMHDAVRGTRWKVVAHESDGASYCVQMSVLRGR